MLHVTDLATEHSERLLERFPDPRVYHERADEITIQKIVDKDIEPENAIVRVAQEYEVDLIVIGTHGRHGMQRVQIGSTAEEVVRRVGIPVLSVTHPIHKVVLPRRFTDDYEPKKSSAG